MRQSFRHEMTRNTRWNPNWCFNNNLTVNKNSWSELDFRVETFEIDTIAYRLHRKLQQACFRKQAERRCSDLGAQTGADSCCPEALQRLEQHERGLSAGLHAAFSSVTKFIWKLSRRCSLCTAEFRSADKLHLSAQMMQIQFLVVWKCVNCWLKSNSILHIPNEFIRVHFSFRTKNQNWNWAFDQSSAAKPWRTDLNELTQRG